MHLWFWALIASLFFIEVTSSPILQARSPDENHSIEYRSYVPKILLPESFTARILARGKDQSDKESVDYVQKALEYLKISARADSGYDLIQPGRCFSFQDLRRKALDDFSSLLSQPFVFEKNEADVDESH